METLRMSRFLLHLLVYLWTSFKFGIKSHKIEHTLKGALSGLKQFLATESPLKMMKNAFHFTSKALFVLRIYEFLS